MRAMTLENARAYEAELKASADAERPAFHLTPAIGWMNDPNGFSMYKGEYHLFYQYYPYDISWGPMHWGHAKTKDFVTWEYLPCALAPDTPADDRGVFSGTALELEDGRQLLVYTGVYGRENMPADLHGYQHQCAAIGDGINYEKMSVNPIIGADKLPEGISDIDFRDPKVFKSGDYYYVLAVARVEDGTGSAVLFSSTDLENWVFESRIISCEGRYGTMWECPDFFPLAGTECLTFCAHETLPEGLEFHAGYGNFFFIGRYDIESKTFVKDHVQAVDYGCDFYAQQTLEAADGRRIMVAWMQNWNDVHVKGADTKTFGSMTLPRELSIKNNRLYQWPVREIENYRSNHVAYKDVKVSEEMSLEGIEGRTIDLNVSIRPEEDGSFRRFSLKLAKTDGQYAEIVFVPEDNIVKFDRTYGVSRYDYVTTRKFYVEDKGGALDLRILVDKNGIEIFANGGAQACTSKIYTPVDAGDITFMARGNCVIDVEKYDLCK